MKQILSLLFVLTSFNLLFAQYLKEDGTPDMSYKENKSLYSSSSTFGYTLPDSYNFTAGPSASSSKHLKKGGTPNRRFKENKVSYETTPFTFYNSPRSYNFTTSVPKTSKWSSNASRDVKGRFIRSSTAKLAFMKLSGYPHGRPGFVVDHVVALKRGGCDCIRICNGKQ